MDKYTYDNIIIDPTKEGIESLIGKEVYFHNNPSLCLDYANKKSTDHLGVLVEIRKNSLVPFTIKQGHSVNEYSCIIEKKDDPKPEFIPFESADEFLDEYDNATYSVNSGALENKLLNYGGVWLKSKKDNSLCMVSGIWDKGLVICDKKMTISDSIEYNVKMSWDKILADFVFLDGTPCGMNSLRRPDNE